MNPLSPAFFLNEPVVEVGPSRLEDLKRSALSAPLKRARFCFHKNPQDPVQEMIIAFARGSYIPPHRHRAKGESFHVLEGRIQVVFFDEGGEIQRRLELNAERPEGMRFYRLNSPLWHSVCILSDFAVVHETTPGPFGPDQSELAPWAPDASDKPAVRAFLNRLESEAHA